ncbi:MAG: aminodeoxychorismate/anthranilate synthase component II [Clostridiales bacterium]|jgi:anthranilate synthase component 2|nr:aminodeoxychorismate/anthranilate synthase component II [Clostridiales bacterium]
MILLIDNYGSFTHSLCQLIGSVNPNIRLIANDEMTVAEVSRLRPDSIILSPGPGRPEAAGICIDIVRYLADKIPILGVCLGHQAICAAFGAQVSYANALMHGKQSDIFLDTDCPLFTGLPKSIKGARYHSLAVMGNTMPSRLLVTARTEDGEIMGVRHREHRVYGLQFHPESILTPCGPQILKNFLSMSL